MDRAAFRDPGTGVPESPCMRSATSYKMQVQFPTFLVCNFLHFYYATFMSAVYERKKIPECYMLGGVVRSEILSKDMVIISAYELERNEENSLFSQEHGNTGLSALRN